MPSAATQRPVQGDNRPPAVQAERGVTGRKMKVAGCVSAFEPCGVLNLLRRPLPRRHPWPAWGAALKQRDLPRVVRISPAASRMHGRTCTLSMTGRAHARCHCRISYIAKSSDRPCAVLPPTGTEPGHGQVRIRVLPQPLLPLRDLRSIFLPHYGEPCMKHVEQRQAARLARAARVGGLCTSSLARPTNCLGSCS